MPSQKITGASAQRKRLQKWIRDIPSIVGDETNELMNRVQTNAQRRAPKQTGALRQGINVQSTKRGTFRISIRAVNPRTSYNYAIIQHNNPKYKHPVGEYLFVTKAMQEELNKFEKRVIKRMRLK